VPPVCVLELDPDLADGIAPEKLESARRACRAETVEVRQGVWDPAACARAAEGGFGLLIISGLFCRRVVQAQHGGAELLGPGDLLRPWDQIGEWSTIPVNSDWLVIEDARLAILDRDFAGRCGSHPEIAVELMRRGLLRSRYLALLFAIVSERRVETRLTMLFWHLADRFGRVHGDWVEIPVPLTHRILAELVAARRPSVSTALTKLSAQGVLNRTAEGWQLHRDSRRAAA
jgi:CRP/FNR family transcriptional regulator, cyclic AMP receptor protein